MAKHRLLVIGAGRIGAGFAWHDSAYTHAGAARCLDDRVELVGFVEPNPERADASERKWGVTAYEGIQEAITSSQPDLVSVCVQPEDQEMVLDLLPRELKGVWCEKPFMPRKLIWPWPIQVNYLRRGSLMHQMIAANLKLTNRLGFPAFHAEKLVVYGKDDIHTRCHFEDLSKWWGVPLDYRTFNGPCAYGLVSDDLNRFFDAGGVDGGTCMRAMLLNLLDHIDFHKELWSPPY